MPDARGVEPVTPGNRPPIGRSWRNLYIIVAGWLAALIALFVVFTRSFR